MIKYYQEHDLDEPAPIDLEDQYFLPNKVVPVKIFSELIPETRAFMNWMIDELLTNARQ